MKTVDFTVTSSIIDEKEGAELSYFVTICVSDDEEQLFYEAEQRFHAEGGSNLFDFLNSNLPSDLAKRIEKECDDAVKYDLVLDEVFDKGYSLIEKAKVKCDVTEEMWNKLNNFEKTELVLEVDPDCIRKYWHYVDISIFQVNEISI